MDQRRGCEGGVQVTRDRMPHKGRRSELGSAGSNVSSVSRALGALYLLCLGAASAQAVNSEGKYLIQQGVDEAGDIFMYSPYYLWNDHLSANPPTLAQPLALRSVNGRLDVELTVQAERVSTQPFDYTSRVFCYTGICSAPGPSLYLAPGDILSIKLTNNLQDRY
ncbi:hypothetical protein B484DRAFT_77121 [Ochromonadaceae sp. CCMP2298]|nr:hypothetical protein B484DRAFT_77121 [Ochromonadaceae sp. CCMP2298]